jgi:hypothetical protein
MQLIQVKLDEHTGKTLRILSIRKGVTLRQYLAKLFHDDFVKHGISPSADLMQVVDAK